MTWKTNRKLESKQGMTPLNSALGASLRASYRSADSLFDTIAANRWIRFATQLLTIQLIFFRYVRRTQATRELKQSKGSFRSRRWANIPNLGCTAMPERRRAAKGRELLVRLNPCHVPPSNPNDLTWRWSNQYKLIHICVSLSYTTAIPASSMNHSV
jgi:hypothetical protein